VYTSKVLPIDLSGFKDNKKQLQVIYLSIGARQLMLSESIEQGEGVALQSAMNGNMITIRQKQPDALL
jgi:hypothetical protein